MNKTITIIGATGKVGTKTTKNLLNKNYNLRLVGRDKEKLEVWKKESGVEVFPGDLKNTEFLTKALTGSDVVLTMLPSDYSTTNIGKYQDELGVSITNAIKKSGVKKVLNLSSVGGHTEEKTGIVAGLARQEQRLNNLEGVDVLHLRPSYFMENLITHIDVIKNMNIMGTPLAARKQFPLIATNDVARVAAEKLQNHTWTGKTVQPLLGPKDYNMEEVTSALAKAIGKPNLPYYQFPHDQEKENMMKRGLNENVSEAIIKMNEGINDGVFNHEKRDVLSTTPTSIEEFATDTFKLEYQS